PGSCRPLARGVGLCHVHMEQGGYMSSRLGPLSRAVRGHGVAERYMSIPFAALCPGAQSDDRTAAERRMRVRAQAALGSITWRPLRARVAAAVRERLGIAYGGASLSWPRDTALRPLSATCTETQPMRTNIGSMLGQTRRGWCQGHPSRNSMSHAAP